MKFVGIDVHARSFAVCILDRNGKTVKEWIERGAGGGGRTSRDLVDAFLEKLKKFRGPFSICYEASCGYGHLHDRLAKVANHVTVAHPGQLRLIFRSKRKNDRTDARKLAMLLLMDQVPAVHVPAADVREWRSLIEMRHRQVAKRVRTKNGLRALLRTHGMSAPHRTQLWTKKGLAWLQSLELPSDRVMLQRDLLLEELSMLTNTIRRIESALEKIASSHPGVALLRTIPGVGIRTAEAVVAYVDDPNRFRRNKRVGSYFGLVPCQDQSGDANRLGHITREGPSSVRKLLTEAAWQGVRRSSRIRAYFERVTNGDPTRRKIALVATAHYLVRVMHAMLRTGRAWEESPAGRRAA